MGASVRPDHLDATIDSLLDAGLSPAEIKAHLSPPQPNALIRGGRALGAGLKQTIMHPYDTAKGIGADALNAAELAGYVSGAGPAPAAGIARAAATMTPEQMESGARGAITLSTIPLGMGVAGAAARIGAPALAANTLGAATASGAAGAALNPKDPVAGAIAGAGSGAILTPALSYAGTLLSRVGGGALDIANLRPSGRTAGEMAADAARMKAPVGPQSGEGTPAAIGAPQPTLLQRIRAGIGSAASNTSPVSVASAKDIALRQLAERLKNDAVTPADALAYADRAGNKPIAVLDLGEGNVMGLARQAKDVPGLARRDIPKFLNERSAGTRTAPGATLQRITDNVEDRIGLKPENYYQTAKQMADEQKALSKPAYDKVRNIEVDDPELLDLFDIPEFRKLHGMIANAERIRPGGATIKPLSTTTESEGGATTRVQNPQTLGTLDKMRQAAYNIARGKIEGAPIDRFTAQAMYERLGAITQRMDELYPDYAEARAGFSGRERMMDAHEAGKEDFLKLDPRELQQKLSELPPGEADMYRKGGYDALRTKLLTMKDGANIGEWLDANPAIRERVAALSKTTSQAENVRSDIGIERDMGNRKNQIIGGPNTAERLIDYAETQPQLQHVEKAIQHGPVKAIAGKLVNNFATRAAQQRTGDIMGEVGKLMTRTGRQGIGQTFNEIAALEQQDLERRLFAQQISQEFANAAAQRAQARRR